MQRTQNNQFNQLSLEDRVKKESNYCKINKCQDFQQNLHWAILLNVPMDLCPVDMAFQGKRTFFYQTFLITPKTVM